MKHISVINGLFRISAVVVSSKMLCFMDMTKNDVIIIEYPALA